METATSRTGPFHSTGHGSGVEWSGVALGNLRERVPGESFPKVKYTVCRNITHGMWIEFRTFLLYAVLSVEKLILCVPKVSEGSVSRSRSSNKFSFS